MPPNCPYSSLLTSPNQQNKTRVLFHYSMLQYSNTACFEHSNFLKSKMGHPAAPPMRTKAKSIAAPHSSPHYIRLRGVLTATTLIYAIGAGITAAAGTRLALNRYSLRDLNCTHSNCETYAPTLLFTVTTSPCQALGNCAPAAPPWMW